MYHHISPCAVCGNVEDPGGARFCSNCGAPRPAAARPAAESEANRRIVTALFADLVGSTAVAERLDPEIWADAAGEALAAMSAAVTRYGGTVARLMGDGILAFFGAPESHEDDAERAVRAALELVDDLAELRARLADRVSDGGAALAGDELSVRVGINTGLVVAGEVGGESGGEFTALGDAVNVAARLQHVAPPGGLLISAATAALVEGIALLAPGGSHALKGKVEPVDTFLVLDLKPSSGRGGPGGSILVGRAEERAALRNAILGPSRGLGGIVLLLGDAGLGKSRLLVDAHSGGGAELGWFQVAARSFEAARPYALAAHLVEALAGTTPGDVATYLGHLPEPQTESVAELLTRLDMPADDDRPWAEAAAEAFEYLLIGMVASLEPGQLVVATDDLHWADAASVELLVRLFPLTDRFPIVFLAAARPERHGSSWMFKQSAEQDFPHRYMEVGLAALDGADSTALVTELAGDLEPDLVARIVERAGGNPFYLEELVREVRSGGEQSGDLLPGSLQTLIQARLDRLEPTTRAVLETAAVAGRTFSLDLLNVILGRDAQGDLSSALRAGIVDLDDPREPTYLFRHALTHEAVYESMLLKRRRVLHLRVAEALLSGTGTPSAAILAEHFSLARDASRAATYSLAAGDEAFRLQAMEEAFTHYGRGLEAAEAAGTETVIALLRGRGQTRSLRGDLDGGIADAEAALERARTERLADAEWETLTALGQMWAARDYERTGQCYRQALEVARLSGDAVKTATSLNLLGNWSVNADNPADGIRLHQEALAMFDDLGSLEGAARSHDLLGMAEFIGGSLDEASSHYEFAVSAFRQLGDRAGLAGALAAMGFRAPNFEIFTAPPAVAPEEGIANMRESIELCAALGWPAGEAFGRFLVAQVLGAKGELGPAMAQAHLALQTARRIGHDQWQVGSLVTLGMLENDCFDFEACRRHLSEAVTRSWEIRSTYWILQSSSIAGMSALGRGETDLARSLAEGALQVRGADNFRAGRACRLVAAGVAAREGRGRDALALLEGSLDPAELGVSPWGALIEGEARWTSDRDGAVAVWRKGLKVTVDTGFASVEWRLRAALAAVSGDPGEREAAVGLLARAAESLAEPEEIGRMKSRIEAVVANPFPRSTGWCEGRPDGVGALTNL